VVRQLRESVCAGDPDAPVPTRDIVEVRPLVTDGDVARWTAILGRNAPFFGVDAPEELALAAVDPPVTVGASTILAGRIATAQQHFAGHAPLRPAERPWLWSYDDPMVPFKTADRRTGRVSICLTGHQWPGAVLPAEPPITPPDTGRPDRPARTAPLLALQGERLELCLVALAPPSSQQGGQWVVDAVTGEDLAASLLAPHGARSTASAGR